MASLPTTRLMAQRTRLLARPSRLGAFQPALRTLTTSTPSQAWGDTTAQTTPSTSTSTSTSTPSTAPSTPEPPVSSLHRPRPTPRTTPIRAPIPPPPRDPADWSTSYQGVGSAPFPAHVSSILRRPLDASDVEIKPDGILYLPEIKYRNILFEAFGAGGWGMVPRGEPVVEDKVVTREWALIVQGRFVSQAQGENNYFSKEQIPRAVEACKSNALMRCCKDLGVAAELWDKRFVRTYKEAYAQEVWVEHVLTKKKVKIWLKRDDRVEYPFKLSGTRAV